jgi:transcription elongation GreA/GreB family factor
MTVDKHRVVAALRQRVAEKQAALTESQRATQAGATHPEARPEHAKDTRATEASYLARGLAQRVDELAREAVLLETLVPRAFAEDEPVAVGALVQLEDTQGGCSWAFVAPGGGGERLSVQGTAIRAVTPGSPLGRALMGREMGDEVAVRLPGGVQTWTVSRVC